VPVQYPGEKRPKRSAEDQLEDLFAIAVMDS
jgi:hypothetical protein